MAAADEYFPSKRLPQENGGGKRLREKCVHTAQVLSDESEKRPA